MVSCNCMLSVLCVWLFCWVRFSMMMVGGFLVVSR